MSSTTIIEYNLSLVNTGKGDILIYLNVVRMCEQKGVSVTSVEKQLGFGNGTIHNWRTASPTIEKLVSVAKFLGCTLDDLLKEDGKEEA